MSEWNKQCSHLELHHLQHCTSEAFCSLLFHVPAAQTSLDCCQKARDLAMNYFPSTMAEICWANSPNHGCGKETRGTLFSWLGIPRQAFALPLSHWNEQTSPCFCINYQGIMQVLGYTHSSHHLVLLSTAAWWKRNQNQTLHHVMKLKGFNGPTHNGASPNLSEFRIDVGLTQNE